MYLLFFVLHIMFSITTALSVKFDIMTDKIDIISSSYEPNILDYMVDLSFYRMDVLPARFLTFAVKACKHVALYASSSDTNDSSKPLYEIAIGSHQNTKTYVRRRNDASLQTSSRITEESKTDNILNCAEYRLFWISWEAGSVKVGSGNRVGENVIVSLIDPDPLTVQSFGIMTVTKVVGEWKVDIPVKVNFTGYYTSCEAPGKRAVLLSLGDVSSSVQECATMCSQLNSCAVFNYQNQYKRCELLSFGKDPLSDVPKSNAVGWQYYAKCYDGNEACFGCLY
ncbi:C3 and PZP-like alpha-2-macroglobulin domain-containing protein 8 [Mytilus trossulus]|uniref:C3 and PZP-like alpha-2-macroglobulin domain-containing protein 8 n=1 Tax=Mytilus trossulus TaxID=6551 RepID=UPI003006CE80